MAVIALGTALALLAQELAVVSENIRCNSVFEL